MKSTALLPALRGSFGDWIYYSCLMHLGDVASRVNFAKEIHKNKRLSDLIQRELRKERTEQIRKYLLEENERFFNSLVVAVYGGRPNWFQVGIKPLKDGDVPDDLQKDIEKLSPEKAESLGLLRLSGDEKMFALDGQHRLAGIKQAIKQNAKLTDDLASVILVAHSSTKEGLQRTRRLFTTLNKTAVAVSKSEIIALDENDLVAITVRRLVEEHTWFMDNRVAFVASANVPSGDTDSLTTIENLYDVIRTFLLRGVSPADRRDMLRKRPDDQSLDRRLAETVTFFSSLAKAIPELRAYFRAHRPSTIIKQHRNSSGGSLVFRPIGLLVLTEVAVRLSKDVGVAQGIQQLSKLPRRLNEEPLKHVLWDPATRTIQSRNRVLARNILLCMLGYSGVSKTKVVKKYRELLDDKTAELPRI